MTLIIKRFFKYRPISLILPDIFLVLLLKVRRTIQVRFEKDSGLIGRWLKIGHLVKKWSPYFLPESSGTNRHLRDDLKTLCAKVLATSA